MLAAGKGSSSQAICRVSYSFLSYRDLRKTDSIHWIYLPTNTGIFNCLGWDALLKLSQTCNNNPIPGDWNPWWVGRSNQQCTAFHVNGRP